MADLTAFSSLLPLCNYAGAPQLAVGREIEVVEGNATVVNLQSGPEAFPFPTEYQWKRNDQVITNTSTLALAYPMAHFLNVSRSESGLYTLEAVNHQLQPPIQEIGRGTGSFRLNVLCEFIPREPAKMLVANSITVL